MFLNVFILLAGRGTFLTFRNLLVISFKVLASVGEGWIERLRV
jgi:hypothetical protein